MRRRVFSILLPVLLGCTPQRDNRDDPARAPSAVLEVKVLQGALAVPGNIGPRPTKFVLDASGSSDPFNRGGLSLAWDLDGDGIFETTTSDPCPVTGLPRCKIVSFALTPAQLPGGVGIVPIVVGVKVAAGSGNHAEARQQLFVTNAAPVLDPGD